VDVRRESPAQRPESGGDRANPAAVKWAWRLLEVSTR
jgi:hypothetical protein